MYYKCFTLSKANNNSFWERYDRNSWKCIPVPGGLMFGSEGACETTIIVIALIRKRKERKSGISKRLNI